MDKGKIPLQNLTEEVEIGTLTSLLPELWSSDDSSLHPHKTMLKWLARENSSDNGRWWLAEASVAQGKREWTVRKGDNCFSKQCEIPTSRAIMAVSAPPFLLPMWTWQWVRVAKKPVSTANLENQCNLSIVCPNVMWFWRRALSWWLCDTAAPNVVDFYHFRSLLLCTNLYQVVPSAQFKL
jgi:hypothetical protein